MTLLLLSYVDCSTKPHMDEWREMKESGIHFSLVNTIVHATSIREWYYDRPQQRDLVRE